LYLIGWSIQRRYTATFANWRR